MVLAATAYPRRCWKVRKIVGFLLAEARSRRADIVVFKFRQTFYLSENESSWRCLRLLNASTEIHAAGGDPVEG